MAAGGGVGGGACFLNRSAMVGGPPELPCTGGRMGAGSSELGAGAGPGAREYALHHLPDQQCRLQLSSENAFDMSGL